MQGIRKGVCDRQLCPYLARLRFSTSAQSSPWKEERMSAWQLNGYGNLSDLQLTSVRVPPIIKPQEVLVKVHAASVNPLDTAMIGGYGREAFGVMRVLDRVQMGVNNLQRPEFEPLSVGRDFSGEVLGIGHGVKNICIGDYICGTVSPQKQGSHTEYLSTNESNVCPISRSISNIQAASFPYAGLTAWSSLVVSGRMKPKECNGMKIIVLGASGGVGSLSIQILKAWGADVVGVCSLDSFNMVTSCGASQVYDYRDPETFRMLTSQPCYDLVLNASGETNPGWLNSLKRWTGASYVSLTSPLLRNADDHGLAVGFAKSICEAVGNNLNSMKEGRAFKWAYYMPNQCALRELVRMVETRKIKPCIDKVYSFKDAMEAYRHVMEGPSRGKTVIDFIEEETI